MGEVRFMISEAAKQVHVESHVLRYWEEELNLTIGRTEMGHRYYTEDDIQLFCCIKKLKDAGMLLKDLKPLVPELKATKLRLQKTEALKRAALKKDASGADTAVQSSQSAAASKNAQTSATAASKVSSAAGSAKNVTAPGTVPASAAVPELSSEHSFEHSSEFSAAFSAELPSEFSDTEVIPITQLEQMRSLIGTVLTEVVQSNNETLKKDISDTVTTDVLREMDFLFQAKERQEEEHFRKLDSLIRQQQANRREAARDNPLGRLKKMFT